MLNQKSTRWYQPDNQIPPAINPTDANGDYRPEYVEWLKGQPIQEWDDIRKSLEAGVSDSIEWAGDEDGFIIRLYADKTLDGFKYIFSVNSNVYDDEGWFWDVESADMPSEHWYLVQACAFMWQSDPTKWERCNF